MKRILIVLMCVMLVLSGCASGRLEVGDKITVEGEVDYSDSPSDIGQEYCFITGDQVIEYIYTDIYGEKAEWESNVFYTKGEDTANLKEYVGKRIKAEGKFDAESHGIPYITEIKVTVSK